jgi:hypothetical protein
MRPLAIATASANFAGVLWVPGGSPVQIFPCNKIKSAPGILPPRRGCEEGIPSPLIGNDMKIPAMKMKAAVRKDNLAPVTGVQGAVGVQKEIRFKVSGPHSAY